MSSKVVVVGSINIDCVVKVNELPTAGETIHGGEPHFLPGGKGGNQAVSVARYNSEAIMVGAVGTDQHGEFSIQSLKEFGVNTDGVEVVNGSTGTAFIFVEDAGENLIVVTAGANAVVTPREVETKIKSLGGAKPVVLCQMELPLESVEQAATTALELDGRFILNLAPAEIISNQLIAKCDPIVVNETEAVLLTNGVITNVDDAKLLVEELAKIAKSAVITLGADGAVYSEGGEAVHLPSESVRVVDTTGAGDAFVGALAASLSHGEKLGDAVKVGLKAGAAAVQHFGAQPRKN